LIVEFYEWTKCLWFLHSNRKTFFYGRDTRKNKNCEYMDAEMHLKLHKILFRHLINFFFSPPWDGCSLWTLFGVTTERTMGIFSNTVEAPQLDRLVSNLKNSFILKKFQCHIFSSSLSADAIKYFLSIT
jgi:hypothetical protein